MKTILFSLVLILGFTLNSQANNGSDNALYQSLSKKVQSVITTPYALKQTHQSQKITVRFAVDEKGEVIAAFAKTKNKDIKLDLEKQFLGLNLSGLQPFVYNSIDIKFVIH